MYPGHLQELRILFAVPFVWRNKLASFFLIFKGLIAHVLGLYGEILHLGMEVREEIQILYLIEFDIVYEFI